MSYVKIFRCPTDPSDDDSTDVDLGSEGAQKN